MSDPSGDADPFVEDLKAFIATGRIMIEELMDQAQSGNIARLHHLESALAVAQDFVDTLESIDQPPASQDESSHDTHDTTHTSG